MGLYFFPYQNEISVFEKTSKSEVQNMSREAENSVDEMEEVKKDTGQGFTDGLDTDRCYHLVQVCSSTRTVHVCESLIKVTVLLLVLSR